MRKLKRQAARSAAKRPGQLVGTAPTPRINDEWQRWIAENLLLGSAVEPIATRLAELGAPAEVIAAELSAASTSPYYQAGNTVAARLAKRDWVLDSMARLAAMALPREVPVIDRPEPDAFLRDHYAASRPVVIRGLIDHWPARNWTLDRFETLRDIEIEVQTGRENDPDYEIRSDKHKTRMPLARLLDRLRSGEPSNDYYVTANNGGHNRLILSPLWDEIGDMPGFLDPATIRDGFFWMGPKGTITPFHHDLTNNFLVQIAGTKRVTLVPIWETQRMFNHLHCYSQWPGPDAFATLPDAQRPTTVTCDIHPGDTLFIPVGWWHHVEGLDTTIGMSFTNFVWDNDFHTSYQSYGAM
ncbi:aspartate beta-hydroxylase [Sphingomonas sp. DBB INV C78]|uniref:cupin-like domain-containing protein n=1 Tax=Sphingomonas sp. DBB INV C78 TaxID=3349434 RepID=UPI0036D2E947